jgi:hypothetical protein
MIWLTHMLMQDDLEAISFEIRLHFGERYSAWTGKLSFGRVQFLSPNKHLVLLYQSNVMIC